MSTTEETTTYERIEERIQRFNYLSDAESLLSWDQQVMMPAGGTPARSRQQAALAREKHELIADEALGEWLDRLDEDALDPDQAAVAREARRHHERAAPVPDELIAELREAIGNAYPVWMDAKAADDFSAFAPALEELVELRREYAAHIDPDGDPYAVLFAAYEPYLPLETATEVLEELRTALVPLIDSIHGADVDGSTAVFQGTFDRDTQESLAREALDLVGFDWERSRLDTSAHPFSSGNQFDARITTRYNERSLLDALTATIHEFGHAQYGLGLPDADYGSPLGHAREMTVHESQSRLWENHIGRSQPFWEVMLPRVASYFPTLEAVTPREVYRAANRLYPENVIRVEADELTYHLHIMIRFEIERELIDGTLDVGDIPGVWNDKYDAYLGVRPDGDAQGCLQDVHWAHGAFGYFPTYTLGSVLAAQLDAAMRADLAVDERIREGDFDPIREWLGERIHRHGQRYPTPELVEVATGEEYSAEPFLAYVREKFGALYGR